MFSYVGCSTYCGLRYTISFHLLIFYFIFPPCPSLHSCHPSSAMHPLSPSPRHLLTFASRLGGPRLPLTRAASMLCGWISSSVVVNSVPPTFRSRQLPGGQGWTGHHWWRAAADGAGVGALLLLLPLLCQWPGEALCGGGLLLLPLPASSCPHAAVTA